MKEIVSLKNKYISIRESDYLTSYGGNQTYFDVPGDKKGAYKRRSGCGMIAIMDVYSYLNGRCSYDSVDAYRKRLNELSAHILWRPAHTGTKSVFIVYAINRLLMESKMKHVAHWCINPWNMNKRIYKMLEADIPVIMCIPFMMMPWQKKHVLQMYTYNDTRKIMMRTHSTNAHFITVTGIVEHKGRRYYRVSSWGRMLYLDAEEYYDFMMKHFLGFSLGNILQIK